MRQGPFAFGDHDLTGYLAVGSVTRPVMPSRRIETTDIPGRDGAYAAVQGLEALEITVSAHLRGRSLADVAHLRRILAAMTLYDEPQPLRLPDEPWAYHLALYRGGAELSRHVASPGVELTFLCTDPVAYGRRRTASVSSGDRVVAGGTYRAWPVVTATPVSGLWTWQITNRDTGDFVRVNSDSFPVGTQIVVDMGLQRCTVNGTDHPVSIDSDFFPIEGTVELGVSNGLETVLEWEERWL